MILQIDLKGITMGNKFIPDKGKAQRPGHSKLQTRGVGLDSLYN